MNKINLAFLFFLSFLLTACAEWNAKKCANTNWYEEGKKVGNETKPMNSMYAAQEECRKFGVAVDTRSYEIGWKEGLKQTCNGKRGYELGASGADRAKYNCPAPMDREFYRGFDQGIRKYCSSPKLAFARGRAGEPMPNCPGDLEAEFKAEYQRGFALYEQVQAIQNRIDQLNREAENVMQQIRDEKYKENTNPDLIRRYQHQYDKLQDEILDLRNQITMLKAM